MVLCVILFQPLDTFNTNKISFLCPHRTYLSTTASLFQQKAEAVCRSLVVFKTLSQTPVIILHQAPVQNHLQLTCKTHREMRGRGKQRMRARVLAFHSLHLHYRIHCIKSIEKQSVVSHYLCFYSHPLWSIKPSRGYSSRYDFKCIGTLVPSRYRIKAM